MRELKSIEEKILDRALYLVGKNRSIDVSIRAIAKEAGVNVSAINYYFHTKEEMLKQVRQFYLTNTLSISAMLDSEVYEEEDRLILATNEIMEYIIRYPGITAILREAERSKEEDELSQKIIASTKEMHSKIKILLNSITKDDMPHSKHKLMIFMAAIAYPIENIDIMECDDDIINHREKRIEYIKSLIKTLKVM